MPQAIRPIVPSREREIRWISVTCSRSGNASRGRGNVPPPVSERRAPMQRQETKAGDCHEAGAKAAGPPTGGLMLGPFLKLLLMLEEQRTWMESEASAVRNRRRATCLAGRQRSTAEDRKRAISQTAAGSRSLLDHDFDAGGTEDRRTPVLPFPVRSRRQTWTDPGMLVIDEPGSRTGRGSAPGESR